MHDRALSKSLGTFHRLKPSKSDLAQSTQSSLSQEKKIDELLRTYSDPLRALHALREILLRFPCRGALVNGPCHQPYLFFI